MQKTKTSPELLAPAGSMQALHAAVEGGADAVYIGGISFNARINAKNFTPEELKEGIALAHAYGVKIYIAANTLIYDREREDYLRAAETAYLCGSDALIVADIGMARELRSRIPIELHASTQLSGHNTAAARLLADAGFSRMVCAREMSRENLIEFCKSSPIEAEVFVHGALCMSTSGQCLFSSIVGGRSGNRGECAQPCRLPYNVGGKQSYPLSPCDLSLAEHITELTEMGVASLKIEGRMKSPEYVRDVTRIWRRLIDEGKNATAEDMRELAKIFSRGGFTDGYYIGKADRSMLGVRSAEDKKQTAELAEADRFDKIQRRLPLDMSVELMANKPSRLTVSAGGNTVYVEGAIPDTAINAPLTEETVTEKLSRLGGTPYKLGSVTIKLEEGLMMPISALNALRRDAVEALARAASPKRGEQLIKREQLSVPKHRRGAQRSAVFYNARAIPHEAEDFFDLIFVPLEDFDAACGRAQGVMLPETVFDTQQKQVEALLRNAAEGGAQGVLVGNVGHLELVRSAAPQLAVYGDMRLNICNSSSAAAIEELGFESFVLSPELSLAQLRDIGGRSAAVVYGRLPLMLTEKCAGRELGGCEACKDGKLKLTDRRGVSFPVLCRYGHRSVIFNSVPMYMADKEAELTKYGIKMRHFIFTAETAHEAAGVIKAYQRQSPAPQGVRRIK